MGCELENIHHYLGNFGVFERINDQSTLAHKVFYANFKSRVELMYQAFLEEVIKPIIGEPFYYQSVPTFRIGLPGNRFVGEYHKDSKYNHQSYEINFNLGLSGYLGEAALKVEDIENSGNFILLECPYGNVFSFDHIDCLHGSDINPNNVCMVSMDFRLALKSLYFDSSCTSVNMKSAFRPGSYFSDKSIG